MSLLVLTREYRITLVSLNHLAKPQQELIMLQYQSMKSKLTSQSSPTTWRCPARPDPVPGSNKAFSPAARLSFEFTTCMFVSGTGMNFGRQSTGTVVLWSHDTSLLRSFPLVATWNLSHTNSSYQRIRSPRCGNFEQSRFIRYSTPIQKKDDRADF